MFLILRLFNSILFLIVNSSIALYTLQRFFRAMRMHYDLVKEIEEFSRLVDDSRTSLSFVSEQIKEDMKEMESDIGKEVLLTHNLTKLSSKVSSISRRFNELEEGIIELARLNYNLENATIETPLDINDEVRKILWTLKRKSSPGGDPGSQIPHEFAPQHRPRSAVRRHKRPVHMQSENMVSAPPSSPPAVSPSSLMSRKQSREALQAKANRNRSPGIVPEVTLLGEQRRRAANLNKPIGFRPPWMCEV